MDNLLRETQETYYDYVKNVNKGSLFISKEIREGNMSVAFTSIIDFVDGLEWLLKVEEFMKEHNFTIMSATKNASAYLNDINEAIGREDFVFLADLFEYEISPIFSEAETWAFENL